MPSQSTVVRARLCIWLPCCILPFFEALGLSHCLCNNKD